MGRLDWEKANRNEAVAKREPRKTSRRKRKATAITKYRWPGQSNFLQMESAYKTRCVYCQQAIDAGDQALWKKGVGMKHLDCER